MYVQTPPVRDFLNNCFEPWPFMHAGSNLFLKRISLVNISYMHVLRSLVVINMMKAPQLQIEYNLLGSCC